MAVIGKIRNRAGLLVGVIFVSLLAFILGDLLTSNSSFITGNNTDVAVIGGKKIDVRDFEAKVEQAMANYKISQNKETIDQATTDQIRDQTWGQLLNEQIVNKQIEKTGLVVSSDELYDMVQGKDPHAQIKQAFTDPKTQQFNPANVIQFLKNMDNDQTGKTRAQWINFENAIKEERLSQKYYDLIKKGLYITNEEAKRDYANKNRTIQMRYVSLPYTSIVDSTVTLTEQDYKTAYNATLDKYKQTEESRKVEYITFDVVPSDEDRNAAQEDINKNLPLFQQSTEDSMFVAQNSDNPMDATFHKKGTLSPMIDSIMFNAEIGRTVGPYMENNAFNIAKLTAVKFIPDSVKASHILFKVEQGADTVPVKAKADSIYNLIKSGNKMSTYASLSEDPGSGAKGGDLGWFQSGAMVPEFNDFCFNNKKGSLGVVKTQFGYHVIEVMDQASSSKQVQVAVLARKIEASSKTFNTIFGKANEFAGKNTTGEAFEKAVKEQGLNMRNIDRLTENEKNVPGLENARELVRWAFKAKKNEVSKPFELADKFVVARVANIKPKGTLPLEDVKDLVKVDAIKDKKAAMLIEKINATGSLNSLDALAQKLSVQPQTADAVNFSSPYLPNLGQESALVGTICALKKGEISKPIKGEQGVYVAQAMEIKEPTPATNLTENKKQIETQLQSRSQYESFNALKEKAKVEDNRGKFY